MNLTDSFYYKTVAIIFGSTVMMAVMAVTQPIHIVNGYIALLPFTVLFSGNRLLNVILALFLFLVLKLKGYINKQHPDPVIPLGCFYLLTFVPSIVVAPSELLLYQLQAMAQQVTMLLFYIIVSRTYSDEKRIRSYFSVLTTVLVFYSIAAVIEWKFFPYTNDPWNLGRIRGPWREYELFSEYLAMMLPITTFFFAKRSKLILYGFLVAILVLLYKTGTRGGPIALCFGLLVWWMLERAKFTKLMQFAVLLALLTPAGILTHQMLKEQAQVQKTETIVDRFSQTTLQQGIVPDTRMGVWQVHMERISKVWLIGEGPCHSGDWFYQMLERSQSVFSPGLSTFGLHVTPSFPHNLYMTLVEQGGVFCLLAFLLIVWTLYAKLFRLRGRLKRSVTYEDRIGLVNLLIMVLTIFLVDELKIEFVRHHHYMLFIFGGFFGFISAVSHTYNALLDTEAAP